MLRKQLLLLILLALLLPVVASWASLQDSRSRLKEIRQRIENAQVDLAKKKSSEIQFSRELALLKRTLQQLSKRISAIKKEQRQLQNKLVAQKQQLVKGQRKIQLAGRRLRKRLVALYKEGEIGPLKILFSADSPTELVQQYHYLTLVMQHDRQLLGEYRAAVEKHQQQLTGLDRLNRQKAALLEKEQQQRKVATDGRRLRSQLLKQVKSEKKRLKQELARLQEKARRLQALISRLQQRSVAKSAAGAARFSAGKGELVWPVNGEVLIGFGMQKDAALGTYYESNGIEIAIAPGAAVHAVADGKVVYADWFRGYGNLLILSHAGGFHTLYAQVAKINKSLGDQVKSGDIVATSGLDGRDSIYFEIRKNGVPVNPLSWLRRR